MAAIQFLITLALAIIAIIIVVKLVKSIVKVVIGIVVILIVSIVALGVLASLNIGTLQESLAEDSKIIFLYDNDGLTEGFITVNFENKTEIQDLTEYNTWYNQENFEEIKGDNKYLILVDKEYDEKLEELNPVELVMGIKRNKINIYPNTFAVTLIDLLPIQFLANTVNSITTKAIKQIR